MSKKAEKTAKKLEAVDSREGLRAVLRPIYDEHVEHVKKGLVRGCPFCEGDIT